VFIGGLQASVVMFLIGAVLSVAVGLISYGVAVPRLVPDKGPRVESGGLDLGEKGGA